MDQKLIDGTDSKFLDNGIILKVGPGWRAIDRSKQSILIQQFLDQFEAVGYDQLQIYDRNGFLIARKSRVGEGMILFDQI